jgi:hypothetical protein
MGLPLHGLELDELAFGVIFSQLEIKWRLNGHFANVTEFGLKMVRVKKFRLQTCRPCSGERATNTLTL